jgi:hypothetical protein
MRQFALSESTDVRVTSVNVRSEAHGKNHVPAVDLRLQLTAANTILEQLKPGLREALYLAVDKGEAPPQPDLEGVEPVSDLPLLRISGLEPIRLADELTGYTVTVDIGLGRKESLVELVGCKVNAFVVEALQGGSVRIGFRVQASGLKEREIGKLGVLVDCDTAVKLEPPLVTEPIDGTVAAAASAPTDEEPVADFREHGRARPLAKKVAGASKKAKR